MIKNYLKIALRAMRRQPVYTSINVAGLTIGLACCMLIGLFVQHERSMDRFHEQGENLYRLNKRVTLVEGGEEMHAITAGLMGPTIADTYPEVEQSLRVLPWFDDVLLEYENDAHRVSDVVFADSNFFTLFDFEMLRGDPATALVQPRSIVLTEDIAYRLFGDVDPLGQTIVGLNDLLYTVTGVAAVPIEKSHLRFNALISWTTTLPGEANLNFSWMNRWLTQVNYTYLLLEVGAEPAALEAKMPALIEQNLPDRADQYTLTLQPLQEIYLHSGNYLYTRGLRLGNAGYVRVLGLIGLLILLIACINFVNLSTAHGTRRAREIGVRKVMGALRQQVARQFLVESILLTLLSTVLALCIVGIVLPMFSAFTGRPLQIDLIEQPGLLLAVAALMLLTGFGAGFYPGLALSRFTPVAVMKRQKGAEPGRLTPRKVLVVLQFAASIVLMVCTLVVSQQTSYVRDADPGFLREHVMVLPIGNTDINNQFETFKQEILRHPNILHAAGSNSVPGTRDNMSSYTVEPEGKTGEGLWEATAWRVDDFDLADTYNLQMASGRFFSPDFATDSTRSVVINESLANHIGWTDPVGKRLEIEGEVEDSRVIGVLEDFHFESLHHEITPLILYVAPTYENISIRLMGGNVSETLAFLEDAWSQFESTYPFEYTFLEEESARYYQTEMQLMQTMGFFAGLAIFIACLGLLGLAAFAVQQRTKEIGVRKLLGASVTHITTLLSKDFLTLVLIAYALAVPSSYLAVSYWLEKFAYRIELGIWVFLVAGIAALSIALLTICIQTFRAGLSNPIEALRYE